jgi:hypothetical protein
VAQLTLAIPRGEVRATDWATVRVTHNGHELPPAVLGFREGCIVTESFRDAPGGGRNEAVGT